MSTIKRTRTRQFMPVSIAVVVFVCFVGGMSGCRLCCDTGDLDYPAYGGSWERTRRDGGRVGSIFDPGGAKVANLSAREDVRSQDEQQRSGFSGQGESSEDGDDSTEQNPEGPSRLEKNIEGLREMDLDDLSIETNVIPGTPEPPGLY